MKSERIIQLAGRSFLTITENGKPKGFIAVDAITSIMRRRDNETVITSLDKSKVYLSESLEVVGFNLGAGE